MTFKYWNVQIYFTAMFLLDNYVRQLRVDTLKCTISQINDYALYIKILFLHKESTTEKWNSKILKFVKNWYFKI